VGLGGRPSAYLLVQYRLRAHRCEIVLARETPPCSGQTQELTMSISRRGFVKAIGLTTAGALSTSFIIGRGREESLFGPRPVRAQEPYDDGIIRISSNENARGPGESAIRAIRDAMSPRMGRGYPPDHTDDLVTAIAEMYGVEASHVIVGTGSGPILAGAARAFCSPSRHLVTAAPSYATSANTARDIGAEVREIPVDASMATDLGRMAEAAPGAGMIFLCNPNNPTGTVHGADAVEEFVREVTRVSPETRILIDEAYIDYAHDPNVRTAEPLTREFPNVFITRSLSKAHGMAGLRVGYAVGQPETVDAISNAWHLGSMNTLSAAAAAASIRDAAHIADERDENARVRTFVLDALREAGYEGHESHANFLFVDLGRPSNEFREACLAQGVRIGRDFPPMLSHSRISLGTMEEMESSVRVFRSVLAGATTAGA
jgi:histidinol-phosphate aminotransferase